MTFALDLIGSLAWAGFLMASGRLLWCMIADSERPEWWLAIVCGLLAAVCACLVGWRSGSWLARDAVAARSKIVARLFQGGVLDRIDRRAGEFVSLATDSVEKIGRFRHTFLTSTIASFVSPAAVLVLLGVFVDGFTAWVLAAMLPLIPVAIGAFNRWFSKDGSAARKARARLASHFLESVQGLEVLSLTRSAERKREELAVVGERNRQATMRVLSSNLLVIFIVDMVFALFIVAAAVLVARWRLQAGVIDGGQALSIVAAAVSLVTPIDTFGSIFYIGMMGRGARAQVVAYLADRPLPGEGEDVDRGPGEAVHCAGLGAGYVEGDLVIDQIDMGVHHGEKVVLRGESGSGKTTLLRVLKGDLLPSVGGANVAGVSATRDMQQRLRERSAIVNQQTWLFTGTVAENLRVGAPSASDEELWEALRSVALVEVVQALPGGLDAQLGERAATLSGGQRQRLAIARALLSKREVLLLDEPTSQIDVDSERIIMQTLSEHADGRTLVMVTHRKGADWTDAHYVDMADGNIVEVSR